MQTLTPLNGQADIMLHFMFPSPLPLPPEFSALQHSEYAARIKFPVEAKV